MFVPRLDFSDSSEDIDWTKTVSQLDLQLYEKYDLTEEEITFIESSIKSLE